MKIERTKNTIRNSFWGIINKFILIILPFISRTIFIKTLGAEYLGINGLFSSILQVLNLAETGFGSAIVFSMYKPIAQDNTDEICALLNLYKIAYQIIGLIIFIVGLILLPFLPHFIKGSYPEGLNLSVVYLVYLSNTALSYFLFAYKKSLLNAHQRNDVISNIRTVLEFIQFAVQLFILLHFKNFMMYIMVLPVITILNNIFTAVITKKMYPQYICKGKVEKTKLSDIKKRISGIFLKKFCNTMRNSMDNIFISSYIGLGAVAIYSNYYLILSSVHTLMTVIVASMNAGLGNSIVTETVEKNHKDMLKFIFMYSWISAIGTTCMLCLYQPFMQLWAGKTLMFNTPTVVLLCLYFYELTMGDIRAAYSEAAGLWWEDRYRATAEAIGNILLNWLLVIKFGIYGIIAATVITIFVFNFIFSSKILYKYYFKNISMKIFFVSHGKYFISTVISAIICYYLCSFIHTISISTLLLRGFLCVTITSGLFYIFFHKNNEYKESIRTIKKILYKKNKN